MPRRSTHLFFALCVLALSQNNFAQETTTHGLEHRGTLILCGGGMADGIGDRLGQFLKGGGQQNPISKRFVELAGGPGADFVIIQIPNSHAPKDDRPLAKRVASTSDTQSAVAFGVKNMTALRFTDRDAADSAEFVAPLQKAKGVWITGGNATSWCATVKTLLCSVS